MCVLKQNQRFADQRPRPSAQSMRCAAQLQPVLQPESRQKRPAQTLTFDTALPNRPHWTIAAVPGCLRGQARKILDADNRAMHESKLWRLLLWLFLGNGGCQHRAWVAIKGMPCAKSSTGQKTQPLNRWRCCALLRSCSCRRLTHERDRLGEQEISPRHQEVFLLVRVACTSPGAVPWWPRC